MTTERWKLEDGAWTRGPWRVTSEPVKYELWRARNDEWFFVRAFVTVKAAKEWAEAQHVQ